MTSYQPQPSPHSRPFAGRFCPERPDTSLSRAQRVVRSRVENFLRIFEPPPPHKLYDTEPHDSFAVATVRGHPRRHG